MKNAYVLLVDDEAPFLETLTKRLAKRNLDIHTADSGQAALKGLGDHPEIEVVILDVKMPGMDGIETLKEIKKEYPLKEVIMLTGHATIESAIDGMKLGAFDYLMKPCEIDVLTAKVDEAAKKKRAHEEKITQARIQAIAGQTNQ